MLGFGAIAELAIARIQGGDESAIGIFGSPIAVTATASGRLTSLRPTIPGGQASDWQQARDAGLWLQREKDRYRARLKAQRLRYEAKLALEAAERELEAEKLEAERQVQLAEKAELQRIDDEESAFLLLVS